MGQFLYKKRKIRLGEFISCWVDRISYLEKEVRAGPFLFQTMLVRVGPYLTREENVTVDTFSARGGRLEWVKSISISWEVE